MDVLQTLDVDFLEVHSAVYGKAQRVGGNLSACIRPAFDLNLGRRHIQIEVGIKTVGVGVRVTGITIGGGEVVQYQLTARTVDRFAVAVHRAVGFPDQLVALLIGGDAIAGGFDAAIAHKYILQFDRYAFVATIFPAPTRSRSEER